MQPRDNRIRRQSPSRRKRRAKQRASMGRLPVRQILTGAGIACVILLAILLIPKMFRKEQAPELVPGDIIDSAMTAITGDASDISYLQREAKIQYNAINEPYRYGDEIVFSATSGNMSYTRMVVFNTETKESETIPAKVKYNNLTGMVMNEKYIVYLDASAGGGGRICCYHRQDGTFTYIKEYLYAMPKLALDGDFLAFLQQAGESTDRLYVCNLNTGETVTPKVFEGSAGATGGVHLDSAMLTYATTYYEGDVLMSRVTTLDLLSGQETVFDWDRLVYMPMRDGNHLAFMSAASGVPDDVYLSENGGTPQLLVSGVTNMKMGDGFLAYTKDQAVYVYVFETGKSFRLNTAVSKALLSSVEGKSVCWYDVTSYDDVDIVKYAEMEW